MTNEQQQLFLASLLEEHPLNQFSREQALKQLTQLVHQKLEQGISFHLAAHQAINELVLTQRQNAQDPRRNYLAWGSVIGLALISLLFSCNFFYQSWLSNQSPTLFPVVEQSIAEFNGDIRANSFNGVDITIPANSPVKATGSGEVIMIENHPQLGACIVIRHNESFKTVYGHLAKVAVEEGDFIKKGERIGESGLSRATQVPQLHYAIIENEQFIDPIGFMRAAITPSPSL